MPDRALGRSIGTLEGEHYTEGEVAFYASLPRYPNRDRSGACNVCGAMVDVDQSPCWRCIRDEQASEY